MAFKEVAGNKKYFKYAECTVDQILVEGKFIRDFQGRYGIQFEFEHKDGEIHVLNSAGQLNYKMEFIKPGQMVRVTYKGMITLDKGPMKGKDSHQFTVDRDDEEALEDATSGDVGDINPSAETSDGDFDAFDSM